MLAPSWGRWHCVAATNTQVSSWVQQLLAAFSCQGRGFYPSREAGEWQAPPPDTFLCGLPDVGVRQWHPEPTATPPPQKTSPVARFSDSSTRTTAATSHSAQVRAHPLPIAVDDGTPN